MQDNSEEVRRLRQLLDALERKQELFSREVQSLSAEIDRLKAPATEPLKVEDESFEAPAAEVHKIHEEIPAREAAQPPRYNPPAYTPPEVSFFPKISNNLEKFIGENLISKIGIIILILGVGIGTKYAIDHELISPATRIILGYLAGLILFGLGIKLKQKYENYSAVLVSGAVTILYFITYFAYNFYQLIPQIGAFALMVLFTMVAVGAALQYNKQVIAHIGLVGAYAVPFLLSNETGNVAILFSYMTIINTGILFISFKKYWKPLYYSSFLITWLIYFTWHFDKFIPGQHFTLALIFITIFFLIFYTALLAYKLIKKEKFDAGDILLLLFNSFIFFGIGYAVLDRHPEGKHLLGLFTLCNAILHFAVSLVIRKKLVDKNLLYLVTGLALTFVTIAIPVQLDGHWITLLWAGEATVLFWIGRTKSVAFYEMISFPLMILAFFSLVDNWATTRSLIELGVHQLAFLNVSFLSSVIFSAAFTIITFLDYNKKYTSAIVTEKGLLKLMSYVIPGILLVTVYTTFSQEIVNYYDQLFYASVSKTPVNGNLFSGSNYDYDLLRLKNIWQISYSLVFLSILTCLNHYKIKSRELTFINLGLNTFALLVFLGKGLYLLSELRDSFLEPQEQLYQHGLYGIGIRYLSLLIVAIFLLSSYLYLYRGFLSTGIKVAADLLFQLAIVWIISSELINWMDLFHSGHSYKLGLSILWGIYALLLIAFGIWRMKKHLRIGAIVLFGITLMKLFFYDIAYLDTIAKTIVFVSLGVLLLIISFLYTKYKGIISGEE